MHTKGAKDIFDITNSASTIMAPYSPDQRCGGIPIFSGLNHFGAGNEPKRALSDSQDKALEVVEKLAAGTPDVSRWTKCFSALCEKRDLQFDQDISV